MSALSRGQAQLDMQPQRAVGMPAQGLQIGDSSSMLGPRISTPPSSPKMSKILLCSGPSACFLLSDRPRWPVAISGVDMGFPTVGAYTPGLILQPLMDSARSPLDPEYTASTENLVRSIRKSSTRSSVKARGSIPFHLGSGPRPSAPQRLRSLGPRPQVHAGEARPSVGPNTLHDRVWVQV